ncbi:uncharacterized protein METZ01_LOCUS192761 [marine metagenome]|uniref:NAD(P)-binding domain-containing protein n=1 Tax=marine metagenome TaxID=408172 RepID=A0A382DQP1_9ZZZZ
MKSKFWANKNVFITGINGFVGGNLANVLIRNGANVYGLMRNDNKKTFLFYMNFNKKVIIVNGEITNKELLRSFFIENKIDICFHLAAQVEVGIAAEYPFLTWETNIRGTYTLLEAIRESSVDMSAIVIASSDKAYGEYPIEKMPYREDYPLKPIYPYGTSKACADLIAQTYSTELFKMPIIITRFTNIYGPGQLNFSALIPDAIRCALGYDNFLPRSNGNSIRDFLFVEDVSELYCDIAKALSNNSKTLKGQVFNAGTNNGKTVKYIIEKIYNKLNNKKGLENILYLFKNNIEVIGEITSQVMTYEKVEKYFGWRPKTTFDEGLDLTIDWYIKYLKSIKS